MNGTMAAATKEEAIRATALAAKSAGGKLARLGPERRSTLLRALAEALRDPAARETIFTVNAEELARAKADGVAAPLVKRLGLDAGKLDSVCDGLEQLAAMPDLLGQATLRRELDDGLVLERVTCPLGLLGVVFESRPDALVQIVGLAWKSGNAVLLKGGREALATNRALAAIVHRVLEDAGIDRRAAVLLEGREDVAAVLGLHGIVEVIVARGSSEFVRQIQAGSEIPVMGHAAGVCHLYLHAAADPAMAAGLAVDGKTTYPAACNATETLLWDAAAGAALDACVAALTKAGVEIRGDAATRARAPGVKPATDGDFGFEFGANIIAVKQVAGIDVALAHIAAHGSKHTEAIVTADAAAAEKFFAEVDAAGVFHNASTRFADGYRYGLGAEVGISTDKLHARGPVGVDGLLTYRWLLRGHGQQTASYGPGKRAFKHRDLPERRGQGS
jgi:glutamate-5-semialdehyde dehydrogenase